MLRVIEIGPAVLQGSLFILLFTYIIILEVTSRNAERYSIESRTLNNSMLLALFGGLIGARLGYALLNREAYADNLDSVLSLTVQGMSVPAGLLVGVLIIAAYHRKDATPALLDTLAPGAGVLAAGFALAHLAEGTLFGTATDLPWGIDLWGESRHPVQAWAFIGALGVLVIWWRWGRHFTQPGRAFLLVMGGNAALWLLLGLWLAEPATLFFELRTVQVMAWLVLAACLVAHAIMPPATSHPESTAPSPDSQRQTAPQQP